MWMQRGKRRISPGVYLLFHTKKTLYNVWPFFWWDDRCCSDGASLKRMQESATKQRCTSSKGLKVSPDLCTPWDTSVCPFHLRRKKKHPPNNSSTYTPFTEKKNLIKGPTQSLYSKMWCPQTNYVLIQHEAQHIHKEREVHTAMSNILAKM